LKFGKAKLNEKLKKQIITNQKQRIDNLENDFT